MKTKLLFIDAAINLVLGGLLLFYPARLVEFLGMPKVESAFFASVLGGVLIGIGFALGIAARGGTGGLGIDGAIVINLCGAGVVAVWLIVAPHVIPQEGRVTLWIIALVVIAVGCAELINRRR